MTDTRSVEAGVILHLHADEIGGDYLGLTEGASRLIGIEKAPRIFTGKVEKKFPAYWIARKQVCLGGGGDHFDEHRGGGTERVRGTSACRLMAEWLGIKDPVLQAITDEINHWDSHVGCPPSHLASILKSAKVNQPGVDMVHYKWAKFLIGCVHRKMAENLQPTRREIPFGAFVEKMIDAESEFEDEEARESLLEFVHEEQRSDEPALLGARHMYESIWRTSEGTSVADKRAAVGDHILHLISLLYKDQINFHSARNIAKSKEYESNWFTIPVWSHHEVIPVKGAYFHGDNPRAHNALRSLGACLTIVKNSKGNVTYQGNKSLIERKSIARAFNNGVSEFTAKNRFGDMDEGSRRSAHWEILKCRGNCPGDPYWYLADEFWYAGYNGTQYHEAPPTTRTREQLIENAQASFDPRKTYEWKKKNHVPDGDEWFETADFNTLEDMLKPVQLAL